MAHFDGGCHCGCGSPTRVAPGPFIVNRVAVKTKRAGFGKRTAMLRSLPAARSDLPVRAIDELLDFLQRNLSSSEAGWFLGRVAEARGLPHGTDDQPWAAIRSFFADHVPAEDTERYLDELKRRKLMNEPLLRI